ncbi:MAG: Hvo_1808 family surface protein [Halococcoides sp.]
MHRLAAIALVAGALVLASGAVAAAPADPETDTIGWEAGVWYNESIAVDPADGLNASEREAVVSRAMARVERVRGIEFEHRPPVRVIGREEHTESVAEEYANVSAGERHLDNVVAESLFLVGESTDATDVLQRHSSGSVQGYYDSGNASITIVSENETAPRIDEITLAQELYHAYQDERFDVPGNRSTTEGSNARNSIIEGDGNFVDYRYEQRCRADWDCLRETGSDGSGGGDGGNGGDGGDGGEGGEGEEDGEEPHVGLFQIQYMPYSSGPAFVRHVYRTEGWDAVDAIYESPPESTEQVIHPEAYGNDEPQAVTVADRSDDDWDRLNRSDRPDDDTLGEAGWFVALWYPAQESGGERAVIPHNDHFRINDSTGEIDELAPYAYDHRYTAGWDGDRIVPYLNDEAGANETGYVAKLVWDSPEEATEFLAGYRQLLAVNGGQRVVGYDGVYRIAEGPFADAFAVDRDGATVRIVNAPSIDALEGVHADSVREVAVNGTAERGDLQTITEESSGAGPGPGPGLAAIVVAGAILAIARWR